MNSRQYCCNHWFQKHFLGSLTNISDETDTAKLITEEANVGEENNEVRLDEQIQDLNKIEAKESEDDTHEDQSENKHGEKLKDGPESTPKSTKVEENPIENQVLQAAISPSFEESSSFEEMDKKKRLKKMLINVIVLGMSFLLMYTAFQVI